MIDPRLAGRLAFAHRLPTQEPLPPGRHALGLFAERDAILVVPEGIEPRRPTPLVVLFHGGGGSAEKILPMLEAHARARGFLLLAPQSLFPTWDLVIGGHGPDRERVDEALAAVGPASSSIRPPRLRGSFRRRQLHALPRSRQRARGHPSPRLVGRVPVGPPAIGRAAHLPLTRHPRRADPDRPKRAGPRRPVAEAGYRVTAVEYDGPHAYDPAVVARGVDFILAETDTADSAG